MADVLIYCPTPFTLPPGDTPARDFLEPRSHHPGRPPLDASDYAAYDKHTLFHDVFLAGKEILAIGPPLLNLAPIVQPIRCRASLPGEPPSAPLPGHLQQRERCYVHRFRLPAALRDEERLRVRIELATGHALEATLQRPALARVFLQFATLQKDNAFAWIADWLRYAARSGVDRVLLYDNASADAETLPERLGALEGVPAIVLVHWPYAYGPTRSYHNRFAQASQLNHAHECLGEAEWTGHFDLDEYPVTGKGRSLCDLLRDQSARTGLLRIDSFWAPRLDVGRTATVPAARSLAGTDHGANENERTDAAEAAPPTARDFAFRERAPRAKAHKYLVRGTALREARVHNARLCLGWWRRRPATETLAFIHFKALSTDWKGWGRTASETLDPTLHVVDERVAAVLATIPVFVAGPGPRSIDLPGCPPASSPDRAIVPVRDTESFMKVLLVEDSESLQRSLGTGLARCGFVLDQARDGHEALAFLAGGGYDVVVLDLMVPGIDGFELLARLRRRGDATFVLILSARDRIEDRVRGLDLGADDYLVKPFAFDELVSRLRALGRRERTEDRCGETILRRGGLALDTIGRSVTWEGSPVALTPSELTLLEVMLRRPDRVFTHDQLIDRVYPSERQVTRNALEAHVSTLRRRLRAAGVPDLIETRRGFGYLVSSRPAGEPPERAAAR